MVSPYKLNLNGLNGGAKGLIRGSCVGLRILLQSHVGRKYADFTRIYRMNIYCKKELSSFIKTHFIPQNVPQNRSFFKKMIDFPYKYAKNKAFMHCFSA